MDDEERLEEAREIYNQALATANDASWRPGANQVEIGLGLLITAMTYQVLLLEMMAKRLPKFVPPKD